MWWSNSHITDFARTFKQLCIGSFVFPRCPHQIGTTAHRQRGLKLSLACTIFPNWNGPWEPVFAILEKLILMAYMLHFHNRANIVAVQVGNMAQGKIKSLSPLCHSLDPVWAPMCLGTKFWAWNLQCMADWKSSWLPQGLCKVWIGPQTNHSIALGQQMRMSGNEQRQNAMHEEGEELLWGASWHWNWYWKRLGFF